MKKKEKKKSAKDLDKERIAKKSNKREKVRKEKRKIKRTTWATMPYDCYVSNYVLLLQQNVKVGKEETNLYSKTYELHDTHYHTLIESEQEDIVKSYMAMINGFDSSVGIQISMVNNDMKETVLNSFMLDKKDDELNDYRDEINALISNKFAKNNNRAYKIYLTITVCAISVDTAHTKFYNFEVHMNRCIKGMNTELVPLTANERIQLISDIYRGVDNQIQPLKTAELARQEDKLLSCPNYFEFKKDYFMYDDKYARCMYFRRLPASISDTLFKELIDTKLKMIITHNIEIVDTGEAIAMLQRKLTDMKQEEIIKVKSMVNTTKNGNVDVIEGTQLALDKEQAQEFLEDMQTRNQKMTLCQFIIMLISDSYENLEKETEMIDVVLSKYQIEKSNSYYRQEQAMASALPLGNSLSFDKEHNLQVRRTLSSESTAIFIPFISKVLADNNGLWYGTDRISGRQLFFDRTFLNNPNGFIFGKPGSGKSFMTKLEMIFSILMSDDEVLIVDPEREYGEIVRLLGGEVIYISESSNTHINPLDLIENPDKENDQKYDPVSAKLDFLLSFFSAVLGDVPITAEQKSIIDECMRNTYQKYNSPTFKEFYVELESLEEINSDEEMKKVISKLKNALKLYVQGSFNCFSKPSNININKRIVCLDTKDLGKNMQTVGMCIVLEKLWERVAINRTRKLHTRIYIDEMYLMFKSNQSAIFLNELYKRARKWGGIPTGITQNIGDILKNEIASDMINNATFVLLFSMNTGDKEKLGELLEIPEETMDYVSNARNGEGLLYASEFGTFPFENLYPTDSKLYKAITTKFKE